MARHNLALSAETCLLSPHDRGAPSSESFSSRRTASSRRNCLPTNSSHLLAVVSTLTPARSDRKIEAETFDSDAGRENPRNQQATHKRSNRVAFLHVRTLCFDTDGSSALAFSFLEPVFIVCLRPSPVLLCVSHYTPGAQHRPHGTR
jgi:hypothetical protein